ncbi:hypothetical protein BGZ46_007650 [Entomortierella lignicola]|nr:hypothetical protein BGZ46_007650 [Entomortierella lignicola]KAF9197247.1 hypothetical protein BGZ49_002403 [Haplosporangium sp. Z 27]
MSNQLLFYGVGFAVFLTALLFCHAYELDNTYIYLPLACFLGFKVSMKIFLYIFPTAFDSPPPPEPKSRQGKKKAAKDAATYAKRYEKMTKVEADAARKAAEARALD